MKKLKWNSVNDKLPKSDHWCLCWIEDKEKLNWGDLGNYQNNNWYLNGGRSSNEIVTHWIKIEKPA